MTLDFINTSLKINQRQLDRFHQWAKLVDPGSPYEEDCSGRSYYTWHFRTSGIVTEVWVTIDAYKGLDRTVYECDLTLDDDGQFLNTWEAAVTHP